jgi:hypothetical protein
MTESSSQYLDKNSSPSDLEQNQQKSKSISRFQIGIFLFFLTTSLIIIAFIGWYPDKQKQDNRSNLPLPSRANNMISDKQIPTTIPPLPQSTPQQQLSIAADPVLAKNNINHAIKTTEDELSPSPPLSILNQWELLRTKTTKIDYYYDWIEKNVSTFDPLLSEKVTNQLSTYRHLHYQSWPELTHDFSIFWPKLIRQAIAENSPWRATIYPLIQIRQTNCLTKEQSAECTIEAIRQSVRNGSWQPIPLLIQSLPQSLQALLNQWNNQIQVALTIEQFQHDLQIQAIISANRRRE